MIEHAGPVSPLEAPRIATSPIVDKILASRAAHPEHDEACLLCGETYIKAQGHRCASGKVEVPPAIEALLSAIRNTKSESHYAECRGRVLTYFERVERDLAGMREENQRLREALTRYGWHRSDCMGNSSQGRDLQCTCGLDGALGAEKEGNR